MTERIDHTAAAREALAAAQMNPADADVITDPWLLAAQVHATLALIEQQRIANIIELSHPRRLQNGGEASYMLYDPETFKLRDDVREGLGL